MKYKWETAEGETFFEPTPPEDPDQPYCQRSGDGPWTCFDGADRLSRPAPDPSIMTEEERQRRSDQLLISRYRSLDAIDLGRDERLRQLSFERQAVERNLESQERALYQQIRAAADRQRAGLTVPDRQVGEMEVTRNSLRESHLVLERLDEQAETINLEFDEMKRRYRQLLEQQTAP